MGGIRSSPIFPSELAGYIERIAGYIERLAGYIERALTRFGFVVFSFLCILISLLSYVELTCC